MKRTETEGAWDATIRKIVWGMPVALVVIGLLILLFAWLQPTYAATVTKAGETFYTPARKMARGTSSAHYRAVLEVEYTDRRGETETASVQFGTNNPMAIPRVGDQILISRGLSGMVSHPNRNLIGAGGGAAVIGGFFLAMFLLTRLRMRRR